MHAILDSAADKRPTAGAGAAVMNDAQVRTADVGMPARHARLLISGGAMQGH